MATKLYINYVRLSEFPAARYEVKQLYLSADKVLNAITTENGRTRWRFRFSISAETVGSVQTPHGYHDTVYRYMVKGDTVHLWVCVAVPTDTEMPVPDYQELTLSGATEIFAATGETINTAVEGNNNYGWVPGSTLSDAEKKARAIAKIKAWRAQKKAWLLEAPEYADLVPNIVTHLGYWLRSADYVIWYEFNKKNTNANGAYDWDIIEEIAKEAIKGPRTLDPDGDGAYNVEFFQRLKVAATGFPTGPTFGALWVRTWDLTSVGNVDRVADFTANVISSHGSTDSSLPDRTYHDIPVTYNSTTEYWTS